MTFSLIAEQIVNGIVAGSMYALMGAGLALVYGTMRVMNFAHGELFMVGGYALLTAVAVFGIHPIPAIVLSVLFVAVFACGVEKLLVQPLMSRSGWEIAAITTTLGLSIALQSAVLRFVGEEYYTIGYFVNGTISIAGINMSYQRLLIFAAAIVTIAVMEAFLRLSKTGWALRAVSQDAQAASILGISTQRIFLIAFGLSGVLSGIAAVMLSPIQSVNPWMGIPRVLKAFVVVVLGGMGSFRGAILAGFIVGIVEAIGTTLTSSEWRELFSFGLLILIIWFKPEGLFGNIERRA
jgi:branched-chain amino acid transport system permease protein